MKKVLTTLLIVISPAFLATANGLPRQFNLVTVAQKAPLGDLSTFRVIATDSLKIAKTGNIKAAEKRITDMETAWDVSANKLKTKNTVSWRKLDLALDRVLFELRAAKPTPKLCVAALQDMVTLMDTMK